MRTYELDLGEEFTTRSPHSIVFTVLGRLGLLGLLVLLSLVAALAWQTGKAACSARHNPAQLPSLGWWSLGWVLLISACFGVVLEGPMGAIVFWTALGIANATAQPGEGDAPEAT